MIPTPHAFEILLKNPSAFEFSQKYGLEGFFILAENDCDFFFLNPKLISNLSYSEETPLIEILNDKQLKTLRDKNVKKGVLTLKHPDESTLFLKYKTHWLERDLILVAITEIRNETEPKLEELKRYINILKETDLGAWQWNVQTGETIFDENWARLLGYNLKELEPTSLKTWRELAHPEDLEMCDELLEQHLNGKTDYYISEARMRHKTGEWVWVKDKGKVVSWTEDGKPEWMAGFQEEITEMKNRLALKKLFIDHAPSAIAMFDNNLKYIAVSNKWLEDYQLEDDIIGKSHYEVFPNLSDEWKEIHQKCLKGETRKCEEDSFIREDGTKQWLSWEVKPWYKINNEIGGILMHTANITPLKKAQKEIFEKQQFLETILDKINVGIVACNKKGDLTLFNRATAEWHGIPAENIPQEKWSDYYGLFRVKKDKALKKEEIPLIKALNGKEVIDEEIRIKPKKGKNRIVSVNGSRLIDEYGEVSGAVAAMHDITERTEADEKLRISEEAFRGSFEHAAIGMATLSPEGKWIKINSRVCEIVGYSPRELKKLTFQEITHPDDLNKDLELLNELIEGKREYYHMDKRYFHKNGHVVYIHLAVSLVRDKKGAPLYFVSQIEDISPRKIAEEKLNQALAKLESLFEASTQVSIIAINKDGVISSFNKGAENLLGYSKSEMIGQKTPLSLHSEEEVNVLGKQLKGKPKGMEVFMHLAENNSFYTREWTYVRKDGNTFPVQLTITSIKTKDKTIGYLGVATDITQIKKAEKEIKNILKITENQNERLKNFAHIVSHNLRSHSGNFGMLLDLFIEDHPEQKDNEIIEMLRKASGNLKETIDHLNEVTLINTSDNSQFIPLNLHDSIEKTLDSVNAMIKEAKINIHNEVSENIYINGIPAYLESILLNFTTNAIKYRSPDRNSYLKYSIEKKEDFIKLKIEDNGLGIDLDKHGQKLFGMYKTFHLHPDSRGIGLFITKNQIEAMGGKVNVKSKINEGTTFEISLKQYEEN